MLQSRRRMPSKWNRGFLKVSSPPHLMTIPEDEDVSCRLDYDCCEQQHLQHHHLKEFLDMAILVAHEREERHLPPFQRIKELDVVAQDHAQRMALERSVFHSVSNVQDLQQKLGAPDVGENITRGDSVYLMYQETMSAVYGSNVNRDNILSDHFHEFGSAMAFGNDGKIYCCQVFRKSEQ